VDVEFEVVVGENGKWWVKWGLDFKWNSVIMESGGQSG
jgi:hypothetical protein